MLSWNAKIENWNAKKIEDYDVLKYHINSIKQLKKQSTNKAEFDEELKMEFMSQYWSRCEYELILTKEKDRLLLKPLLGKVSFVLDVTDEKEFDWNSFFKYHSSQQGGRESVKIDIFDQLMWRWEEFVDYCWYARLPYERKSEKFER